MDIAIFFELKKDGTIQFCAEVRKLNKDIVRHSSSTPQMDKVADLLGNATVFSSLDTSTRYLQIKISEFESKKISLSWHHGFLQFIYTSFGLKTQQTPSSVEKTSFSLQSICQVSLVYLCDTGIFSKNGEEDIKHVRHVLTDTSHAWQQHLKNFIFLSDTLKNVHHVLYHV